MALLYKLATSQCEQGMYSIRVFMNSDGCFFQTYDTLSLLVVD
jgi:hypothetical protein